MANLFWKALLIAVLLQCSFPSFANVDTLNSEGVTESGKDRHWQENGDSDDISLQQLQENYNNNTLELMEFIKSLTTTLSKRLDILEKNSLSKSTTSKPLNESISSGDVRSQKLQIYFQNELQQTPDTLQSSLTQRLDFLEKKLTLSFDKLSLNFETLKFETSRQFTKLEKRRRDLSYPDGQVLNNSLITQTLETTTPKVSRTWTPDEYLSSVSPPTKGRSFNGKSIEQIAAGVPDDYSLTVEIANYLDVDYQLNYLDVELTDYQLFLGFGLIHQGAPTVVAAKTREVVTFKRVPYGAAPHGVLLYRVGDTGVSLHLVFYHAIFAVGFLENKALISTIWPIWEGCNKYTHSGTPDSMRCIGDIEIRQNQIRNLTIHHGPIYTKLTIQTKKIHHRWILTMEVFKLDT